MFCIYSWSIWQYISHPRWHESLVNAMPDDDLSFWTSVLSCVKGDWWKTIFTIVIVALIVLLCGLFYFTMYYELCNPKVDVILPNWRSESQGAIYPYEWCSYYELRAPRVGNEGGNRKSSNLKAGLHLGPDCGLWAICPVFMEMTYQLENQTTPHCPQWKSPRARI